MILAEYLRARGAHVSFICRTFHGHLCNEIEHKGFPLHRLHASGQPAGDLLSENYRGLGNLSIEQDAIESCAIIDRFGVFDWLIVDHYGLDATYEKAKKATVDRELAKQLRGDEQSEEDGKGSLEGDEESTAAEEKGLSDEIDKILDDADFSFGF